MKLTFAISDRAFLIILSDTVELCAAVLRFVRLLFYNKDLNGIAFCTCYARAKLQLLDKV